MVDRVVSKRRRIMREFLIKEVSAVDRPAQGHARAVIMKRADDEDDLYKSIPAAPALADPLLTATGSEGGSPMTDAEKKQLDELQKSVADLTTKLEAATAKEPAKKAADLAGELEKAQAQLAEITKKLEQADAEKAVALAKAELCDDEKDYLEDKDEDSKKAFLDLSPEDRKKTMKKAADADPVIYKSESTGEEFRKSDDPRLVKMAKAVDEGRKIAKEEREKRETSELSKRVDDELSVFSEDIAKRDDKIEVLRAIDKMEAGPQAALLKMLEIGGKAISAAFETIGHKRSDVVKSGADFEKRVSEIMSRDKITKLAALDKAAREFPAEFEAYQAGGAQLSN